MCCGTENIIWNIPIFRVNMGNIVHNTINLNVVMVLKKVIFRFFDLFLLSKDLNDITTSSSNVHSFTWA